MTPDEINALPTRVKQYIHDLETNADPAGTIQDLAACRENCDALQERYRKLAAALQYNVGDRTISPAAELERLQSEVERLDAALEFFGITEQDIRDAFELEKREVILGKWSKKPPAKQGWYWYRKSDAQHAVPTFVEDCGGDRFRAVEVYEQHMIWLDEVDVEWWQIQMEVPRG